MYSTKALRGPELSIFRHYVVHIISNLHYCINYLYAHGKLVYCNLELQVVISFCHFL